MIGGIFWSKGITVERNARGGWGGYFNIYDGGFAQSGTCQGKIELRYQQEYDLQGVIDHLLDAAVKLNIQWGVPDAVHPHIYYEGDGSGDIEGNLRENAPDNWREIVDFHADRLGWHGYDNAR